MPVELDYGEKQHSKLTRGAASERLQLSSTRIGVALHSEWRLAVNQVGDAVNQASASFVTVSAVRRGVKIKI